MGGAKRFIMMLNTHGFPKGNEVFPTVAAIMAEMKRLTYIPPNIAGHRDR